MLYTQYAQRYAQACGNRLMLDHDECAHATKKPDVGINILRFASDFQRELDAALLQDKTAYSCLSTKALATEYGSPPDSGIGDYLHERDVFFKYMLQALVEEEALASQEQGYVAKTKEHLRHAWTFIINNWWQQYIQHDACRTDFPLLSVI